MPALASAALFAVYAALINPQEQLQDQSQIQVISSAQVQFIPEINTTALDQFVTQATIRYSGN